MVGVVCGSVRFGSVRSVWSVGRSVGRFGLWFAAVRAVLQLGWAWRGSAWRGLRMDLTSVGRCVAWVAGVRA